VIWASLACWYFLGEVIGKEQITSMIFGMSCVVIMCFALSGQEAKEGARGPVWGKLIFEIILNWTDGHAALNHQHVAAPRSNFTFAYFKR
jgi:hypothetical protein